METKHHYIVKLIGRMYVWAKIINRFKCKSTHIVLVTINNITAVIEQGAQGVTSSRRRLSGRQKDMSGEDSCIHEIYLHSSLRIYKLLLMKMRKGAK